MPDEAMITDSLDNLASETQSLRDELLSTRTELTEQTREARRQTISTRIAIGLVFVLLACTIAAAFQVTLQNAEVARNNTRMIQENNRKFCPIILGLAPQPGDVAPPGTPAQQARSLRIRTTFSALANDPAFGCR